MRFNNNNMELAVESMRKYESEMYFNYVTSLLEALEMLTLRKYMDLPLSSLLGVLDDEFASETIDSTMLEIAVEEAISAYALSNEEFLSLEVKQCFRRIDDENVHYLILAKLPDESMGIAVVVRDNYANIVRCAPGGYSTCASDITSTVPCQKLGDYIKYLQCATM